MLAEDAGGPVEGQTEGPVKFEPFSISTVVAWLIAVPVAGWWTWVLVSFVRAQALMTSCEICVSPNYAETRDVFKAEGIYYSTANLGWLSLIPTSILLMPLSVVAAVLFMRGDEGRQRTAGISLAVVSVLVPIVFMIVAQDQITWISDFTD